MIDPQNLVRNEVAPPVRVLRVIADHKAIGNLSDIKLPALTRDVEIDYAALSLVSPEKVRFRYALWGADKEWQDAGSRREAYYMNLPPGHYQFQVIACNNDGVWNQQGDILNFSIAPAYYQTIWFRIALLVLVLMLLCIAYVIRVRQLARQFNMTLEARVGERTRIARELHDTLLQSFQGLLLRFQSASNLLPTRPVEAKQRLDNALDHAAAAITEGRDAVQGLRSSVTETNELRGAITAVGKELVTTSPAVDAPAFKVEIEGGSRPLNPLVRDEALRIAGEALRNAFRHSGARCITVEIRYDARQFRLFIRDDGKGVDEETIRGGHAGHFGMRGMRERAQVVGGRLEVWSKIDAGTQVELSVPGRIAYDGFARRSWLSRILPGHDSAKPSGDHK